MMLACGSMYRTDPSLVSAIAWSMLIVVPMTAFLLLPKLVPLRRRLMWLGARSTLVLLRLLAGRDEARAWRARIDEAFARDVAASHIGTRRSTVTGDPRLLRRVKIGGIVAAVAVGLLGASTVALILSDGDGAGNAPIAGLIAACTVPGAWLARAAGEAVMLAVLGRTAHRPSWLGRLCVGGLLGALTGALGGWTVGVAGMALFVPSLSVVKGFPRGTEFLEILSATGAAGAFIGASLGAITAGVLAALPRRDR